MTDTDRTSKTVTEHELKVASEFFDAVESGQKPFEIRKGDRPFKVGDTLWLREVDIVLAYTGREARKRITFVLRGWGMESGYVALGLSPSPDETTEVHPMAWLGFPAGPTPKHDLVYDGATRLPGYIYKPIFAPESHPNAQHSSPEEPTAQPVSEPYCQCPTCGWVHAKVDKESSWEQAQREFESGTGPLSPENGTPTQTGE